MSIVSYLYPAMLIVVVVHRLHCKVGLSIDYVPPLATCVEPSDSVEAIPCRVAFSSGQVQLHSFKSCV